MREHFICALLWAFVEGSVHPVGLEGSAICAKYRGYYRRFDNMSALLAETHGPGNHWSIVDLSECQSLQNNCAPQNDPVCAYSKGKIRTFANICLMHLESQISGVNWNKLFSSPCNLYGNGFEPPLRLRSAREASILEAVTEKESRSTTQDVTLTEGMFTTVNSNENTNMIMDSTGTTEANSSDKSPNATHSTEPASTESTFSDPTSADIYSNPTKINSVHTTIEECGSTNKPCSSETTSSISSSSDNILNEDNTPESIPNKTNSTETATTGSSSPGSISLSLNPEPVSNESSSPETRSMESGSTDGHTAATNTNEFAITENSSSKTVSTETSFTDPTTNRSVSPSYSSTETESNEPGSDNPISTNPSSSNTSTRPETISSTTDQSSIESHSTELGDADSNPIELVLDSEPASNESVSAGPAATNANNIYISENKTPNPPSTSFAEPASSSTNPTSTYSDLVITTTAANLNGPILVTETTSMATTSTGSRPNSNEPNAKSTPYDSIKVSHTDDPYIPNSYYTEINANWNNTYNGPYVTGDYVDRRVYYAFRPEPFDPQPFGGDASEDFSPSTGSDSSSIPHEQHIPASFKNRILSLLQELMVLINAL